MAYSSRTGLACENSRMKAMTVSQSHGGLAPSAKIAAKKRLTKTRNAARSVDLAL